MSDEEYISDKEFLANLRNIDNEKLIQSLQNCGHDGYYNDLYYPIVKEIKRRLSSTSAVSERTAKVVKEDNICICDNCSGLILTPFASYKYCPECGVKLDWSDDE